MKPVIMIDAISLCDYEITCMNLDVNQLRAFVTVAELKSFSQASRKLFRVQSAVSQQVQKLEGHVGAELFSRGRQRLELTARGESMLAFAIRILELNDLAVATMKEAAPGGLVRVGTSDAYASKFFADILRLCKQLPDLEVEVCSSYSARIWSMYERGELDVALTQGCPGHIVSELLYSEPLVWVASANSDIAFHDTVPLALYTKGCGDRDIALEALIRVGKNYRINFQGTSHAGIMAALQSGQYVSVALQSSVGRSLRVLGPSDGFPALGSLDISLACSDKSPVSPAALFAEVARCYFSSLLADKFRSPVCGSQGF